MLLDLLDSVAVGLLFGMLACVFLVSDGKHGVEVYRFFANLCGIILFAILVCSKIVRGTLESVDDLEKKLKVLALEIELKKLGS